MLVKTALIVPIVKLALLTFFPNNPNVRDLNRQMFRDYLFEEKCGHCHCHNKHQTGWSGGLGCTGKLPGGIMLNCVNIKSAAN